MRLFITLLCLSLFCQPGWTTGPNDKALFSAAAWFDVPDKLITCVSTDQKTGDVWLGSELHGLIHLDRTGKAIASYAKQDGMGDDSVYATLLDNSGWVWAGNDQSGVSVLAHQLWTSIGIEQGLAGEHVYCITCNTTTNDIWIGTSGGVSWYQSKTGVWKKFTRLNGLPSDQIYSIAVDSNRGQVWLGTACNGIAMGTLANGFSSWQCFHASPQDEPLEARGTSLPSDQINGLLVSTNGTVYVATSKGLAWCTDGAGLAWTSFRSLAKEKKLQNVDESSELSRLPENYITTLFEDDRGHIWLGFRERGISWFDTNKDPESMQSVDLSSLQEISPITGFAEETNGDIVVGTYGSGLLLIADNNTASVDDLKSEEPQVSTLETPKFPASPTLRDIEEFSNRLAAPTSPVNAPYAVFLGDDWITQGDWVGRYGRRAAILCAMASPADQCISWLGIDYLAGIGPNSTPDDGVRLWVQSIQTKELRSLYSPVSGCRRQSEWDDHGEAYPMSHDGPDVWVKINIPEGIYRLSLYFVNKDGRTGNNRFRDFLVKIKTGQNVKEADANPDLCHCRISEFWNGVYKDFAVVGPCQYWVQIERNHSFNTIISGVFLDRLFGPKSFVENSWLPFMEHTRYAPPVITNVLMTNEIEMADNLWKNLEITPQTVNRIIQQREGRMLAYRYAAKSSGVPTPILDNWRWNLCLWNNEDRSQFDATMSQAIANRQAMQAELNQTSQQNN